MLFEGKVSTMLKALASRHFGSCSIPNVNTKCVLSLFVFFAIAVRSFSAGAPIFPPLENKTCTFQFDLRRTNSTINRWKNLDPLHQNRRWENSAFFPSRGFILDFFFGSRREGLLFHFILSKIGVLEFLSFSWVNKLHLFYHPLYSVIWC